jgi:hypothetical protein
LQQDTAVTLSLVQFRTETGRRCVGAIRPGSAPRTVLGVETTLALSWRALSEGTTLAEAAGERLGETFDLDAVEQLAPIDHPDPARLFMSGTGLTHVGSAESRDQMHRKAKADAAPTDSLKMFLMGLEGGRPEEGQIGVQPEWFYKGDGSQLVGPGQPLPSPAFALDGGEEAEIAGVYLIDQDRTPVRLGFALANEFSDHVTERGNYLWLAHSKLRPAALGPELLLGDLPQDVRGTSRILREGKAIWEKAFLSGEANMSHTIANLEHHHFKYAQFRRPGDVHVHFLGAAAFSFSDGVHAQAGDVFEIEAEPFQLPARNPLAVAEPPRVAVKSL